MEGSICFSTLFKKNVSIFTATWSFNMYILMSEWFTENLFELHTGSILVAMFISFALINKVLSVKGFQKGIK